MFKQSMQDYPALYIALLGALALCLALWIFALRASKKRRARRDSLIAGLEREHALRREFAQLTREKAIAAPPERLLEGLRAVIQQRLEAREEAGEALGAAYAALPQLQKQVYALGYVIQDGGEALSGFFKPNGPPLTDDALDAVYLCLDEEAAGIFRQEFDAFDGRNESASLVLETILSLDAQWESRKKEAGEAFFSEAKEMILSNLVVFID